MSNSNFSEEFRRDAVRQITERGYPVSDVSYRLGVCQRHYPRYEKIVTRSAIHCVFGRLQAVDLNFA
jgi:transposase